jgi:hypothetical protein
MSAAEPTIVELALELDCAMQRFDAATAHLSRGMGKRARRRVLEAYEAVRAASGRVTMTASVDRLDDSRDGARAALVVVLEVARRTGAIGWTELIEIVNDVAERVPAPRTAEVLK